MKTARFLLACAAACTLAACGSDITAPSSATRAKLPAPRHDTTGDSGQMGSGNVNGNVSGTECTWVLVIAPDGTLTQQCVTVTSQMGSGN